MNINNESSSYNTHYERLVEYYIKQQYGVNNIYIIKIVTAKEYIRLKNKVNQGYSKVQTTMECHMRLQ